MHNANEDLYKTVSTNVCLRFVVCRRFIFIRELRHLKTAGYVPEGLRSHTPASCIICRHAFMHAHRHTAKIHLIVILYH